MIPDKSLQHRPPFLLATHGSFISPTADNTDNSTAGEMTETAGALYFLLWIWTPVQLNGSLCMVEHNAPCF